MEDMLNIEGKLYQVEKGQIKLILIGDNLFKYAGHIKNTKIESKRIESTKIESNILIDPKDNTGRGKHLGSISNNVIYENILNEIKNAMEAGETETTNLMSIIGKYYPKYKENSKRSVTNKYKSLIYGKAKLNEIQSEQPKKRYKRYRPKNAYSFSKTYHVWVKKEDVEIVKKALNKVEYNYIPTVPTLLTETKMKSNRLMATLNVLRKKGLVKIVREPGKRAFYRETQ